MRLYCYPLPTAGKPLLARTVGWLLIPVSLCVLSGVTFLLGVALVIASAGRDVVMNDGLTLRYALFNVKIESVEEIANLSGLNRGGLVKWVTTLTLEPFFLVVSVLFLLEKGSFIGLILPALLYWAVLYSEIVSVPLRLLKERLGLAVLLPLVVSLPFALTNERAITTMLAVWIVGTLLILNVTTKEAVVVRSGGKSHLLLCENPGRLGEVLANVPQDG
ncbi:hypothetical protein [Thermococcus sp.]